MIFSVLSFPKFFESARLPRKTLFGKGGVGTLGPVIGGIRVFIRVIDVRGVNVRERIVNEEVFDASQLRREGRYDGSERNDLLATRESDALVSIRFRVCVDRSRNLGKGESGASVISACEGKDDFPYFWRTFLS